MCGCEKHHDEQAECTCICPEHGNFQAAYDLAMQRYDVIRDLAAERDALRARLDAVRAFHHKWGETPSPDDLDQMDLWTDLGHILTRQEGAADD